MNYKVPVVIFGDSLTAFGVVRSLSIYGMPIYLVSKNGKGMATKSRFIAGTLLLRPDDLNFVEKFNEWVKRKVDGKIVSMVSEDLYLDALAKNYNKFARQIIPTYPDWKTVSVVREKRKTLDISTKHGILYPKSLYITTFDEMHNALNKMRSQFPVIVKPEISNKYRTRGILCFTKKDILDCYRKYNGFHGKMLIQEMIPGPEENLINVSLVQSRELELLGIFMNKKKRSAGLFGVGTLVSSMWNHEAARSAIKIVKEIGIWGYTEVEFKYDNRTSSLKLIEINGRISMLNSHALRCGINLPHLLYLDAIRDKRKIHSQIFNYPKNILWWNFPLDLVWILKHKKYLKPLKLLGSFKGEGYIIEPIRIKDPYPFFYSIFGIFRNLLSST
jgi:predicted ATP-grasp superfamily ATP-dependent carboligase